MKRAQHIIIPLMVLVSANAPGPVAAQELADTPSSEPSAAPGGAHGPAQLDFELDPIAYALKGFSVHAGLRYQRLRFDLGAFGLEVPEWFHKNSDFTSTFAGFGIKVDYRFMEHGDGLFMGLSAGRARQTVTHEASAIATSHYIHDVSVRVGYDISIVGGFYLAPWVSVGHMFGSKEVNIEGDTFAAEPSVNVFPTVHLGYRL